MHKKGLLRIFGLLVAVLFITGCATTVKDTTRTFQTVVIDAGHGGKDNGTRSRWAGNEKELALDVARRVNAKLRAAGFKTVMTRSTDCFIELNERAAISNRQHNAVFVSIHFNDAGRKRGIRGVETYYHSAISKDMAARIEREVLWHTGARAGGIKTANFRVIKRNNYPAILVECGYLSCPSEGRLCATAAYREKLATGIADALIKMRGKK